MTRSLSQLSDPLEALGIFPRGGAIPGVLTPFGVRELARLPSRTGAEHQGDRDCEDC
jgi:hypothetical protein